MLAPGAEVCRPSRRRLLDKPNGSSALDALFTSLPVHAAFPAPTLVVAGPQGFLDGLQQSGHLTIVQVARLGPRIDAR